MKIKSQVKYKRRNKNISKWTHIIETHPNSIVKCPNGKKVNFEITISMNVFITELMSWKENECKNRTKVTQTEA